MSHLTLMVKQRKEKRKKGACSDSYMEEKIRYIQHQRDRQKIKNKKYATSSTIDYFAIVATRQKKCQAVSSQQIAHRQLP